MFKTSLASTINKLVEQDRGNWLTSDERGFQLKYEDGAIVKNGVMIPAWLHVTDQPFTDNEKRVSEYLLFVFCGNVNVFVHRSKTNVVEIGNTKMNNWENTSNHDSCWRSDGVDSIITKSYFEMCKKANPNVAPNDLLSESTFGFGNVLTPVQVKYKTGKNYKNNLVSVTLR